MFILFKICIIFTFSFKSHTHEIDPNVALINNIRIQVQIK